VLLGEIKRDRKRLEQHKAVVDDAGQPAVGIERKKLGRARAGVAALDRQMVVRDPDFLGDPKGAKRARARDAIDAQARHAVSRKCAASLSGARSSAQEVVRG